MFSSDMLMDNIWTHLEEAPVEKSWCFHSCSFYLKINSPFIVTYMYWNSFTFHKHLNCFTCAILCGFFLWTFFQSVEFPSKSPGDSCHYSLVKGCMSTYRLGETWHLTTIESFSLLSTQTLGNPIGEEHPLRPPSFPKRL